jgi:hypothetical protein
MARDNTYAARPTRATGSRRVDRSGGRGGLRKLLPLLLLLLLAVLIAATLISMIGGGDSSSDAGQLSAGGAQLLPTPAGGLSGEVGKSASGKDVVVQSVNGNEGFFVGSSTKDRVYVEWGGDVGENEASRFQPKKGDRVNLTGPVQAAGAEQLRKLKLSGDDLELVRSQGAFVNAERVTETKQG